MTKGRHSSCDRHTNVRRSQKLRALPMDVLCEPTGSKSQRLQPLYGVQQQTCLGISLYRSQSPAVPPHVRGGARNFPRSCMLTEQGQWGMRDSPS